MSDNIYYVNYFALPRYGPYTSGKLPISLPPTRLGCPLGFENRQSTFGCWIPRILYNSNSNLVTARGITMLKHQHKTLAKTLDYVGRHSPGEFGLFWDPDGTMPWKEFYWALQEDPSLRFVRESSLRELSLLGIDVPFVLDGNLLRISDELMRPKYRIAADLPGRLYFGIRSKSLVHIQKFGLLPSGRSFVPLSSDRELALRIAKRRDPDPLLLEVLTDRATESGISFLVAGPELYLAEAVPAEFLLFPKIRQDLGEKLIAERAPKPKPKPSPPSPGSFIVEPHHFGPAASAKAGGGKGGKKEKRGWKKEARKERRKRDI